MLFDVKTPKRIAALLCLGLGLSLGIGGISSRADAPVAQVSAPLVVTLGIDGAIGPATSRHVEAGLREAAERNAAAIVLAMDTPGGLDTAMREIIQGILNSPIPVIVYVSPSGARAASAGTYILYASHVAAMAPGTNLGAATPVAIGAPFGGGKPGSDEEGKDSEEAAEAAGGAMERKAVNDAVAYIRSLAEMRGRNVDWAERAVRSAESLSAHAALDAGVIDIVSPDVETLLASVDGRVAQTARGPVTLRTEGAELANIEADWRTALLAAITNPNVALILMAIGVYGLIFEFMNPGALYPGVIGAIALLIGLYALQALPVNYAGLALIVLGLALMTAEAFAPSFGILGIGGGIAFVVGAVILFDRDVPGFAIAWPVIGGVAAASLLVTLVVLPLGIGAHRRKVVSGREEMVGLPALVQDWRGGQGHVFVHGERWRAKGASGLDKGQTVRVTAIEGLTLHVAAGGDDAPPTPFR